MANYTYKVVLIPQEPVAAEVFLNERAEEGWRLVQYIQHSGYGVFEKQGPS